MIYLAGLLFTLPCLLQPVVASSNRGTHHNLRRLSSSNASHDLERPEYVHSLGQRYNFAESDGWESFTARTMDVGRQGIDSTSSSLIESANQKTTRSNNDDPISDTVKAVLKTLQAIGAKILVTITW